MATTASSLLPLISLSLLLLLVISLGSGGNVLLVQAEVNSSPRNSMRTWCVAKPSADDATLLANINYACSMVDCTILKQGCPCFYPNNLLNHASVAMNLYYQSRGRNYWNCHFQNSGLVTVTDPSCGSCTYA